MGEDRPDGEQAREVEVLLHDARVTVLGVDHRSQFAKEDAQRIPDVDCVLVEMMGSSPAERRASAETMTGISEGTFPSKELDELLETSDDYLLHLSAGLKGRDLLIFPIDTPEDPDDELWQMRQQEKTLADNPDTIIEAIALSVKLDDLREKRMAGQIKQHAAKLREHLDHFPKIAVVVGLAHTLPVSQHLLGKE